MAAQPWGGRVESVLAVGSPPPGGDVPFALQSGNAYLAPALEAVDFALTSGYVPPAGSVNFLLTTTQAPPGAAPQRYATIGLRYGRARPGDAPPARIDISVAPPRVATARLRYGRPPALQARLRSPWNGVPQIAVERRSLWGHAAPAGAGLHGQWRAPGRAERACESAWTPAIPADAAATGNDWGVVGPRDAATSAPWERAQLPAVLYDPPPFIGGGASGTTLPVGDRVLFSLLQAPAADFSAVTLVESVVYRSWIAARPGPVNFSLPVAAAAAELRLSGFPGYVAPPGQAVVSPLDPGYGPPFGLQVRAQIGAGGLVVIDPPPRVQRRSDPDAAAIAWGDVPIRDARLRAPWGPGGRYSGRDPLVGLPWINDPPEPPPQPPSLRVHLVMNTVQVVRLPDLVPIEVDAVDLSANVESWSWTVRLELSSMDAAALLVPDGNGPRSVRITMNGYVWTAVIEGRDRRRGFAQSVVSVTGRSRTALLDSPYAPRRSGVEPEARSARQLGEAALASTGFDLSMTGADWLVPGGAWYYQDLTPVGVLGEIAAAAGAVLQSHPSSDEFVVRPRYPIAPWAWTSGVADLVLPANWIVRDTTTYASKPMFDAVIVRGEQQGVQARVIRAGSAGELFAEQVVHRLITHQDVALQRATAALSDRGEQELVDVQIPLFVAGPTTAGATGLYLPLNLIEVQDLASTWRGLSVGVSISARRSDAGGGALEIWQNLSIERHLTDAN